jgi:hypothetical protein
MNFAIGILLLAILGVTPAETPVKVEDTPCMCKKQGPFPVPPASQQTLFYIQRTPNTNTIMYDLNLEKGVVDADEPVHAYWLRYSENGQKEELSFIQRHYAYGIKAKKIQHNRFELRFVSYKKLPFLLTHSDRDNRYHIRATINGVEMEVSQVFLQIEGGSFWLPNVMCVEVKGIDPDTGKEITQTFKP